MRYKGVSAMSKLCIFNKTKSCSNCGDCNNCDITPGKMCNNCGKCLELQGYDIKAIKIDEIQDSSDLEFMATETEYEKESAPLDFEPLNNTIEDNLSENLSIANLDEEIQQAFSVFDASSDEYGETLNLNIKDDIVEYIDDIEEARALFGDDDKLDPRAREEFPGLIVLDNKNI